MDDLSSKNIKNNLGNKNLEKIPKNLIDVLNVHVIDFDIKKEHVVHLNQIKYNDNVILFKSPLKIRIKRENDLFYFFEDLVGIVVINAFFQKALYFFQKQFYFAYIQHKNKDKINKVFDDIIC